MKGKSFFAMILMASLFVLFSGCSPNTEAVVQPPPPPPPPQQPPPPPPVELPVKLTTSILQRLDEYYREELRESSVHLEKYGYVSVNIDKFQLLLDGGITLERDEIDRKDTVVAAGQERGKVLFEDIHTKEVIIINDQTEGLALKMEFKGDIIVLAVCFGDDSNNRLMFSNITGEPDALFYLNYHSIGDRGSSVSGDVKGEVEYGGKQYIVKYTGERPYLLIRLSQKDSDNLKRSTVPGRRVR
ncbi:MAG: hypothetical protein LBH97_03980 [Treponema sp.]|jgi:hypothetical protein|nr:hypothetical protein [Treponema sp.]